MLISVKVISLLIIISSIVNAKSIESYTISVCTIINAENAFTCIDRSLRTCKNVYIIGDKEDGRYRTNCEAFLTYEEAKEYEKTLPEEIKVNGPFVKNYDFNLLDYKTFIGSNKVIILTEEFKNKTNDFKQQYIEKLFNDRWNTSHLILAI